MIYIYYNSYLLIHLNLLELYTHVCFVFCVEITPYIHSLSLSPAIILNLNCTKK